MIIGDFKVKGNISDVNEVLKLLNRLNMFAEYIGNSAQRNEAYRDNHKINEKLKELGVEKYWHNN